MEQHRFGITKESTTGFKRSKCHGEEMVKEVWKLVVDGKAGETKKLLVPEQKSQFSQIDPYLGFPSKTTSSSLFGFATFVSCCR